MLDPCITLMCYHTHNLDENNNAVTITIENCKKEIVFKNTGSVVVGFSTTYENSQGATNRALKKTSYLSYKYNPDKTPQFDFPFVEKLDENEESIKKYLDTNNIDDIEGIYKSYQSDDLRYYKFGIIKNDDKYKAIIIESDYKQWKIGEVKAVFEKSSMKDVFSVKWYMGNKIPFETFGILENNGILSIEFINQNTKAKKQDNFIKMYPQNNDKSIKKDDSKSCGSGFFLTTNGIIATNAHVIEDATNFKIIVNNEIGNFTYNAILLKVDTKNDVALLQINDDKFKGLTSIPYGIIEKSEVGETVFTIGYPLNDIMGSNFKVTDGIISSKSGIADDVRYYQISVPLQPGNSGGPLFNKEGNVIGITTAKLNSKAIGTQVENVNYAIKSSYLLNLFKMSSDSKISSVSTISKKELQDQIKVLKNYVCLIKVY